MNSIISRIISLLFISLFVFSCNNNDDSSPEPFEEVEFFPLKVGNFWVYEKHENTNQNPDDFYFTNLVDSVFIVNTTVIDGKEYFVENTKRYNVQTNSLVNEWSKNIRVNELGHLVNSNGKVEHPGTDQQYTYNDEFNDFVLVYQLASNFDYSYNGNIYDLFPYIGTPRPEDITNNPNLHNKSVINGYEKGVGKVYMYCPSINIAYVFEMKLVAYHLN